MLIFLIFLLLFRTELYRVVWLIIIVIFLLLFTWLLTAPIFLEIDTRIPAAQLRWRGIGSCRIWYEQEWLLYFQVLFYHKSIRLGKAKTKKKKTLIKKKKKPAKPSNVKQKVKKGIRVVRSFTVLQWQLAIDTGDYTCNARLYALNFNPSLYQHLSINFNDQNYLFVRIRNRAWKMLYAYLK